MIENLNLSDKRILLRVDYNVPIQDAEVIDDYRIKKSLKTINYCLDQGASVTIMSHLGRPNGFDENFSLLPVAEKLSELLNKEVIFSDDCISDKALLKSTTLEKGQIHLLENLRFHNGELENCLDFSKTLSFHGDVYINDAFGTAHRPHASNVGIVNFFDETSIGFLMKKELKYLLHEISDPIRPFSVLMGGAKIKGKIELIENFLKEADNLIVGGALSFPFLKVKGYDINSPLINNEDIECAKHLFSLSNKLKKDIILPYDFVVSTSLDNYDNIDIKKVENLDSSDGCFDIGPETTMYFSQILSTSETILWNGPLGVSENPYFGTGTQQICRIIEELSNNGIISILGGGDTAAAAQKFSQFNTFSHISTGGGASLELLSGKKLPALLALEQNEK
ncbi:MAG: phosphoglycerate kinase [Candidatus Pelagibacter sp. TMED273]|nr:MAG: phosphoglycerate kinase [Candidatus Pelagibacter sp. TMED273]